MAEILVHQASYLAVVARLEEIERIIGGIQDALGTGEQGAALIEVARNAHNAEQELAALLRAKATA